MLVAYISDKAGIRDERSSHNGKMETALQTTSIQWTRNALGSNSKSTRECNTVWPSHNSNVGPEISSRL